MQNQNFGFRFLGHQVAISFHSFCKMFLNDTILQNNAKLEWFESPRMRPVTVNRFKWPCWWRIWAPSCFLNKINTFSKTQTSSSQNAYLSLNRSPQSPMMQGYGSILWTVFRCLRRSALDLKVILQSSTEQFKWIMLIFLEYPVSLDSSSS